VTRPHHRRCQHDDVGIVDDHCFAEDRHEVEPIGPVLDLHIGREHVGAKDLVHPLGLLGWLEEQVGAVHGGDVEVGPDPAGGGQEQAAAGSPIGQSLDVGRDEVVEPTAGVGSTDGGDAPAEKHREGTPPFQRVELRCSRGDTSFVQILWPRSSGQDPLAKILWPGSSGRISIWWRYPGPSS
jgi:hypothetical protein